MIECGIEVNKIYNENCLDTMARMPDNFVDLVVTSPPYDDLRIYKGFDFPFYNIASELHRVVKQGGVAVWVVGDATVKGSETGTSFKQALYFKEIGFNLHDTMIYKKVNPVPSGKARYINCFEYMFVFSKGSPKTFNPITQPAKDYRKNGKKSVAREMDGTQRDYRMVTNEFVPRQNIFEYPVGLYNTTSDKEAFSHPAMYPEQLAEDHIISWSNEGDLIYDPFMGSGTTAKMAMLNKRNYIGSEIAKEYCDLAEARLQLHRGESLSSSI